MRRIAACTVALLAAGLCAAGCGQDGSGGDGAGASGQRERAPFSAVEQLPAGLPAAVVRLDDARWRAARRVAKRTAGGRVLSDEVPTRAAITSQLLRGVGIEPPSQSQLDAWLGEELLLVRTEDGWGAVLDAHATGEDRHELGAKVPDVTDAGSIARDPRWEELASMREHDGALALVTDGGRVGLVGADRDGIWVRGRLRAARICPDASQRAIAELEGLPLGVTLAAAAPSRDVYRASALITQAVSLLTAATGSSDVLARIGPALSTAARELVTQLDAHADERPFGIVDAGARSARVVRPSGDDGTMRDDPGFLATKDAAHVDEAADALWLDAARLVRTLGEQRVQGVAGSVAGGLADGVDGVLVWRGCDGTFGARIALPAA